MMITNIRVIFDSKNELMDFIYEILQRETYLYEISKDVFNIGQVVNNLVIERETDIYGVVLRDYTCNGDEVWIWKIDTASMSKNEARRLFLSIIASNLVTVAGNDKANVLTELK